MCSMCHKNKAGSIHLIDGKLRSLCVPCACLPFDQIQAFFSKQQEKKKTNSHRLPQEMKLGGDFSGSQWALLKKQYDYTCLCCKRREPDIRLVADHIIPKSRGGPNVLENIQPLCVSCNAHKGIHNTDYRPASA